VFVLLKPSEERTIPFPRQGSVGASSGFAATSPVHSDLRRLQNGWDCFVRCLKKQSSHQAKKDLCKRANMAKPDR
jgi:hypothetical protein